ncbi:hypothetical protein HZS_1167 [Henneguya salminicola]|nr:hypothetical protein HZS_1167 [Henneguya salminicola]
MNVVKKTGSNPKAGKNMSMNRGGGGFQRGGMNRGGFKPGRGNNNSFGRGSSFRGRRGRF